jgi:hypothetical protein
MANKDMVSFDAFAFLEGFVGHAYNTAQNALGGLEREFSVAKAFYDSTKRDIDTASRQFNIEYVELDYVPPVFGTSGTLGVSRVEPLEPEITYPTLAGSAGIDHLLPTSAPRIIDYPAPDEDSFLSKDIVIPDYVDEEIAPMVATFPVLDIPDPVVGSASAIDIYRVSDLMNTATNKLLNNIESGGTMLNPQVEADIWNRDSERQSQGFQDAMDKLTGQWAKLGWSVPDGALQASYASLHNEYMNKRLDASRDIAVAQAKLEQEGMFKSLALAKDFEEILLTAYNEYAKRVFDATKHSADVAIELFKARCQQYNNLLEAFKADAAVFKTRADVALSKVEVYKAKLSALMSAVQIDETRVKLYESLLSSNETLVKMYTAQVGAAATVFAMEKTKVEIYKDKVQAYAATIDADSKMLSAWVELYKAESQAAINATEIQHKNNEGTLRVSLEKYKVDFEKLKAIAEIYAREIASRTESVRAVGQIGSSVAAGALSAMHASVSDSANNVFQTTMDLTPNA